jgi:hypothetical protein
MDGKAIDTKIVRFPCSPSLEASSVKEAHDVTLKLKSVHAEQKLAKRGLICWDGETGGVRRLLPHRGLHLRGSTAQTLIFYWSSAVWLIFGRRGRRGERAAGISTLPARRSGDRRANAALHRIESADRRQIAFEALHLDSRELTGAALREG